MPADSSVTANLKELCLEMTGHSDDPAVAFEQWRNERAALSEIYDAAKKADDLIIKLATLWRELNSLLFGPKMRPVVLSIMRSESARNRLSELIAKFEKWDSDSTSASGDIKNVVDGNTETLTQLKLM